MIPWISIWAPCLHFPGSGNVAQRIEPDTNWFFDTIPPCAGNAHIEQRVVENVASYGKQLGIISEVVLGLVEQIEPQSARGRAALEQLRSIQTQVEQIKQQSSVDFEERVDVWLSELKHEEPERYALVRQHLASRLGCSI